MIFDNSFCACEMKGHSITSIERYLDDTRHMVEFTIKTFDTPYGQAGDRVRLYLNEDAFQQFLRDWKQRKIMLRQYAHVTEGHLCYVHPRRWKKLH